MTLIGLTGGVPRYDPYRALAGKFAAAYDWRRSDLITLASGVVSSVDPVVGSGAIAQATGSARPTWSLEDGVTHDGINDWLGRTSSPMPTAAPFHWSGLVYLPSVPGGQREIVTFGGNTPAVMVEVFVFNNTSNLSIGVGTGSAQVLRDSGVSILGLHLIEVSARSDGHVLVYIDGVQVIDATVTPSLGTNLLRIGTNQVPNRFQLGSWFVHWFFAAGLTADEALLQRNYLLDLKGTI